MRTSESGASAINANNKGKKLCDYVFIDGKLFDKVDDFSYQEHFLEQIWNGQVIQCTYIRSLNIVWTNNIELWYNSGKQFERDKLLKP